MQKNSGVSGEIPGTIYELMPVQIKNECKKFTSELNAKRVNFNLSASDISSVNSSHILFIYLNLSKQSFTNGRCNSLTSFRPDPILIFHFLSQSNRQIIYQLDQSQDFLWPLFFPEPYLSLVNCSPSKYSCSFQPIALSRLKSSHALSTFSSLHRDLFVLIF
ncbi:hypothetical protein BpHYR1_024839 [Brachionus plicatilis]|uniref:Uncharacterized protein n=1 Tax=Brachionus plicatilis TaxID=10195 RepID=A0A3M7PKY8_BRAPC|nr:hypothetical protein BpHYR1_024839 [Brachionus plicatilis]